MGDHSVLSDIEIAQQASLEPITTIAEKLGIPLSSLENFGRYKAKVGFEYLDSLKSRPDGKLILVTAISPTPAGEGKTTTTIGLGDALNRIGRKTVICLREPSLGPGFGMKVPDPELVLTTAALTSSPAFARPFQWSTA